MFVHRSFRPKPVYEMQLKIISRRIDEIDLFYMQKCKNVISLRYYFRKSQRNPKVTINIDVRDTYECLEQKKNIKFERIKYTEYGRI